MVMPRIPFELKEEWIGAFLIMLGVFLVSFVAYMVVTVFHDILKGLLSWAMSIIAIYLANKGAHEAGSYRKVVLYAISGLFLTGVASIAVSIPYLTSHFILIASVTIIGTLVLIKSIHTIKELDRTKSLAKP